MQIFDIPAKRSYKAIMIAEEYRELTQLLIDRNISVATMESCTSGLVASLITDTEGASAVFRGAFVTYGNEAKIRCGVSGETIEKYGVYSGETAAEMACACRERFGADIGIGITGTFGNADPANPEGVPGQIFYAINYRGRTADFFIGIPPLPSRNDYKMYTAEQVCRSLRLLLS